MLEKLQSSSCISSGFFDFYNFFHQSLTKNIFSTLIAALLIVKYSPQTLAFPYLPTYIPLVYYLQFNILDNCLVVGYLLSLAG